MAIPDAFEITALYAVSLFRIARGGIVIRARFAIRAKCRAPLVWLIRRQLCRLVTDCYERGNKALT